MNKSENIFNLYKDKKMNGYKGKLKNAIANRLGKNPQTIVTWFHFKNLPKSVTESDKDFMINWMQNAIKLNQ